MASTLLPSMRRKALAGFGLALFVLGINWCLVGAMVPSAAAGMACMPSAGSSDAQAAKPVAHVGHCAGMTGEAGDDAPAAAPAAPCCIALTPVMAPEIGKVAPATLALLDVPFDAPAIAAAPHHASELLRAPPEPPPHLAAPRALSAPRAPPTI